MGKWYLTGLLILLFINEFYLSIGSTIDTKDVVDRHREKTFALLWKIVFAFQVLHNHWFNLSLEHKIKLFSFFRMSANNGLCMKLTMVLLCFMHKAIV